MPWGSQVEMLVDIAMCKYIYCKFELPEEIPHFEPSYHYPPSIAMNMAYEMMLLLPQKNWPEIIDLANQFSHRKSGTRSTRTISKPRHVNEAGILAKGRQAWWVSCYPLIMLCQKSVVPTDTALWKEKKETTGWGYLV